MSEMDQKPTELEALFAAARAPALPPDLSARILADAAAEQPRLPPCEPRRLRPHRLRQVFGLLGGWPGLGGLVAASAAGVWIGVAPPGFLPDPMLMVSQAEQSMNLLDVHDMASILSEEQ